MFISDFAIRRPIVTVVVMVALVVFGIFALFRLDVDEFPDIQAPVVQVGIVYPGASPENVEREVTDRVEDQIQGISGIDQMMSTSQDGFSQITVVFLFQKPIDQAQQDVRDAISAVRADLPAEIKEPIVRRFDENDLPIVSLALTSTTLTVPQLTRLADPGITGELRSIPGVAQVNVTGGDSAQLTVQLRPADLQATGVGVQQVVQALQAQNLAAPVGRLNDELTERTIRLRGRLENPEDFLQLVVSQRNGQLIRLGQVADVFAGAAEPRSLTLFNGRAGIGLDIVKSKGFSTSRVASGVLARVDEVRKTLPPGAKLEVVVDAGTRVRNSVRNVEEALVEGAILTVLVVFLFLNSWRSTVITGLALPVSTIAAFIAVWAFGFTLNTMSLLGLSLAIGILIDDAIVVRENIVRHVELGEDHYKAAHTGTDEIGLAVAATTFSIVAVFAPVAFMYGVAGQWFKPFALTIACAVLVSLFVSFSLDPMLSAYWPDPQIEAHERRNAIARALDRFNMWFEHQADRYKRLVGWALDHRLTMVALALGSFAAALAIPAKGTLAALVMIGAAVVIVLLLGLRTAWYVKALGVAITLVLMFVLVGIVPTVGQLGGGFVPVSDRSEINISLETPPGSSLEYTGTKSEELARIIRAHPEVAYTYATIGSASGTGAVDAGNIYVRLVPKAKRHISQDALSRTIREELRRVGGVTAYVFSSGFGGNRKQVQVQLRGPDAVGLARLAEQLADTVRKVPGAVDVGLSTRGQRPELELEIRRGLAGSLGLTVSQIAQALRPAFAGLEAGNWVDPSGETRYVRVRLAPEARQRMADLQQLPIVVGTGPGGVPQTIPLGQVAEIRTSMGPAQIEHLDRERVVTVGANVEGRSLGEVSQAITKRFSTIQFPPGYHITQGGEVKDQNEVFGRIFAALGIAVMLMYLILVVQFGSFLDPLAIMISLPLSLIGVVLALILTGSTLNIMSLIGVILLMGIVAKNAILLIDFAKWGRERGLGLREALVQAGRIRLRPILMTTFALIAGMVPVALGIGEGADFRSPLGRAVIGGTLTSTLLTLLVIPTVYEILDEWREWLLSRFRRRAPAHGATPHPVPAAGDD